MNTRAQFLGCVVAFAAGAPLLSASCADEGAEVYPIVEIVGSTGGALGSGQILWANGTYTGCTGRSGSWSACVSGCPNGSMDHAQLSVVHGDSSCSLALTAIRAGVTTYDAQAAISLGTAYLANATPFKDGATLEFLANAKLSSVAFTGPFSLTILFSGDNLDSNTSTTAAYASVSSSASESMVPAPNYSVSFGSFSLLTDMNFAVTTSTGNVGTTLVGQSGENFVVSSNQSLGATYANIDTEYVNDVNKYTVGASIPASNFNLVGETLPKVRTVIISHAQNGVRAYQVIRITFNHQ